MRSILAVRHFELTDPDSGMTQVFDQPDLLCCENLSGGGCAGIKPYVDLAILRGERDVQPAQMLWLQRELQFIIPRGAADDFAAEPINPLIVRCQI